MGMEFEIIKPYHNIDNYIADEDDVKYLQESALKDSGDDDKVTHLIFYQDELIGYFTLFVNYDGMPREIYQKASLEHDLPDRDMLPLIIIQRLSLVKKYDNEFIKKGVFKNIVENCNNIFGKFFDGINIKVGDKVELKQ